MAPGFAYLAKVGAVYKIGRSANPARRVRLNWTPTQVVLHALERHLAAPPEVVAAPLPPARAQAAAEPPRKRGRPRKNVS